MQLQHCNFENCKQAVLVSVLEGMGNGHNAADQRNLLAESALGSQTNTAASGLLCFTQCRTKSDGDAQDTRLRPHHVRMEGCKIRGTKNYSLAVSAAAAQVELVNCFVEVGTAGHVLMFSGEYGLCATPYATMSNSVQFATCLPCTQTSESLVALHIWLLIVAVPRKQHILCAAFNPIT